MKFDTGTLLNRREIYSGKIIEVLVDEIEVAGRPTIREVIRHPGGVVVLAEVPDRGIPFVRQYRYPLGEPLLELPAGRLEPGEDPARAAARELQEETGYRARELRAVGRFFTTPGFCDEILHLYHTDRVEFTGDDPEFDEQLVVEYHSLEEALALIETGAIRDAKTMIALYWRARQS